MKAEQRIRECLEHLRKTEPWLEITDGVFRACGMAIDQIQQEIMIECERRIAEACKAERQAMIHHNWPDEPGR